MRIFNLISLPDPHPCEMEVWETLYFYLKIVVSTRLNDNKRENPSFKRVGNPFLIVKISVSILRPSVSLFSFGRS